MAGGLPLGVSRGWHVWETRGRQTSYVRLGVCNCFFLKCVWVCECVSVCAWTEPSKLSPRIFAYWRNISVCFRIHYQVKKKFLWFLFHFLGASLFPPFAPTPRTTNPTPDASFLFSSRFFSFLKKHERLLFYCCFSDRMCARHRNFCCTFFFFCFFQTTIGTSWWSFSWRQFLSHYENRNLDSIRVNFAHWRWVHSILFLIQFEYQTILKVMPTISSPVDFV